MTSVEASSYTLHSIELTNGQVAMKMVRLIRDMHVIIGVTSHPCAKSRQETREGTLGNMEHAPNLK